MAELSEKELLFLSNLMYLDDAVTEGRTVGDIIKCSLDQSENDPAAFEKKLGAGMSVDDFKQMANIVKDDSHLTGLKVVMRTDPSSDINAACFVDDDGEATVAFMGTGGTTVAWSDNADGLMLSDTVCQMEAENFINDVARRYKNITVTGHSKGGNLSMYTSVVCGRKIDRCVSFDGQGFDDEFREKYASKIEANKGKITNIYAYNDYVSPLLVSIAGTKKCVNNKKSLNPLRGHYPADMFLANCSGKSDLGDFTKENERDPAPIWGLVDGVSSGTEFLTNTVGKYIPWLEPLVTTELSLALTVLLSEDHLNLKEILKHYSNMIGVYFQNKFNRHFLSAEYTINLAAIRSCAGELADRRNSLQSYVSRIEDIRRSIEPSSPALAVNRFLLGILVKDCNNNVEKLSKAAVGLEDIYKTYGQTELRLVDVVVSDC